MARAGGWDCWVGIGNPCSCYVQDEELGDRDMGLKLLRLVNASLIRGRAQTRNFFNFDPYDLYYSYFSVGPCHPVCLHPRTKRADSLLRMAGWQRLSFQAVKKRLRVWMPQHRSAKFDPWRPVLVGVTGAFRLTPEVHDGCMHQCRQLSQFYAVHSTLSSVVRTSSRSPLDGWSWNKLTFPCNIANYVKRFMLWTTNRPNACWKP